MMFTIAVLCFVCYVCGSFSTSIIIGRVCYNIDVRKYGSKNAGATNTFRVLGKVPGIIVLCLDAVKGFLPLYIIYATRIINAYTNLYQDVLYIIMLSCIILGHIFPVFFGYRGGKGIASLLGGMLFIEPHIMGIVILFFILNFLVFRIVSISVLLSVILYCVTVFVQDETIPNKIFSVVILIVVFFMHRKNIQRLCKGEESKFSLSLRK